MPSISLLAAGGAVIILVIFQVYQSYLRSKALSEIPTHTFEDGDNSRERFVKDLKSLLESGYRKYNRHGRPFKVSIPIGGYSVDYRVVLPKDHLEEIKHLSNNTFSWQLASRIIFAQDYTGAPDRGAWSGKALRVGIHQNLESITRALDMRIDTYFEGHLPQVTGASASVNLMNFFVPTIGKVTNALLVDERLSNDPEWVRQTCDFAVNRYKAADDVRAWPPYLATLMAPMLPSVRKLRQSRVYVKKQMRPLYEELKRQQSLGMDKKEQSRKAVFAYGWLWGGSPDGITLDDFSDTMMRTLIASIHTTAKTISIALVDLLSQPGYLAELGEEANANRRPDGGIDVEKLVKMDCFLKESQRLTPVFLLTMNRIVTWPYEFKDTAIATRLPPGTLTTAAVAAVATDPDTFTSPNTFDGHRYHKLREQNKGSESHFLMGMATEDSLGFGLGSQACPARFLAVNQMKLMMSKLITQYDLTLEKNGEKYEGGRPEMEYFDFSVMAPSDYSIRLTKKQN